MGRDCIGDLQLLPDGLQPEGLDRVNGIVVDEEANERHLLEVFNPQHHGLRDPEDDFRISLAGAQEKDAFLWWDGKWMNSMARKFLRAALDGAMRSSGALWHPESAAPAIWSARTFDNAGGGCERQDPLQVAKP